MTLLPLLLPVGCPANRRSLASLVRMSWRRSANVGPPRSQHGHQHWNGLRINSSGSLHALDSEPHTPASGLRGCQHAH